MITETEQKDLGVFASPIDVDFAIEIEVTEVEAGAGEGPNSNIIVEDQNEKADAGVQVWAPTFGSLRISQFENDPKGVQYYTGFNDINHFRFFFGLSWTCCQLS